jgi:hypothetical protein
MVDMNRPFVPDKILKRVLWLYGLYALLSNAAYLFGYTFLPEGFMRTTPFLATGQLVAGAPPGWAQLALTLLFNLGVMAGLAVVLNFNQVRGFPLGYVLPISLGLLSGLVSGTNSFAASDLRQYNAWDGMALGLSIGGLEMLAYILIIAATAGVGIYQYQSWWRWSGQWQPAKMMRFRDIRLSRQETAVLATGILLLVAAALRETFMVMPG